MLKKIFSILLILAATSLQAQTNCNITVETYSTTCNGGADGKAEIRKDGQLVVINGGGGSGTPVICGAKEESSISCSTVPSGAVELTQTSGTITMGGGNTYYLKQSVASGTSFRFTGAATLVICAPTQVQEITFPTSEPVLIHMNAQLTVNTSLSLPANATIKNYASLLIPAGAFNGKLYSHGSFTVNGDLNMNAGGAVLYNTGTIAIMHNFIMDDGAIFTNSGNIGVSYDWNNNNGSIINHCTMSTGSNFMMNGAVLNYGLIDVWWGNTYMNSGTYQGESNSLLKTQNLMMNTTAEGIGSTCASILVKTNTTINGTGRFQGKLDLCQGNGTSINNGTFITPATISVNGACACSPVNPGSGGGTSGGGQSGGVNGTVSWSSGTSVLNGSTVNGLTAGTYTVTVNLEGCDPVTLSFTITQPAAITASATLANKIATITASGGNAGGYTYVWSDGVTGSSNTRDLTNNAAGTYCVEVKDSKACSSGSSCVVIQGPVIVTNPTLCDITVQYTSTQVVIGSPGTDCCSWSVITAANPEGVAGITVNRPCEDSLVTLKNCLGAISTVTIEGKNNGCSENTCVGPYCNACTSCLNITYTATPARCYQPSLVHLTVTGGINNSYRTANAINSQSGLDISGLPPGTHDITVFDITTQVFTVVSVIVPATPQAIIALVNATDPALDINNAITLTTSDASTGPYTIEFSNFSPYYQAGIIADNGSLGTYTIPDNIGNGPFYVTVTDNYCNRKTMTFFRSMVLCQTQNTYDPVISVIEPVRVGGANGSLSITNLPLPAGASAVWTGPGIYGKITGTVVNELFAGTYEVMILNQANNCVISTETVVLPDGPAYVLSATASGCTLTMQAELRRSNGDLLPNPSSFIYRWINPYNGEIVSTSQSINLSTITLAGNPGFLQMQLFDFYTRSAFNIAAIPAGCNAAPCNATLEYKIVSPTCAGGNDGAIQIIATDGSQITWLTPSISNRWGWTQNGLSAGMYEVQVHKSGCTYPAPFSIGLNGPASMIISRTDFSPGGTTISVSNGTSPYSYKWKDQSTSTSSNSRTGLISGTTYEVTVTDVKGCSSTLEFIYNPCAVNAPDPFVVYTEEGDRATAIANGGIPEFEYYWEPLSGQPLVNRFGPTKFGLEDGNYLVTVTDANGCAGTSTYSHPGCGSFQPNLHITPQGASSSDVCDGSAEVSVTGISDYSSYVILWDRENILELLQKTDGLRAIQEESSIRVFNVCSGTHEVFVKSGGENACAIRREFIITGPITDPPDCEESTLGIQVNGSSTVTKNCENTPVDFSFSVTGGKMPYAYSWSYTPVEGDEVIIPSDKPGFTDAQPGAYSLTVTDALGCSKQQSFTVNGAVSTLNNTAVVTQATCANGNGSVAVTASGGTGSKSIVWRDNASTDFSRTDLVAGTIYSYVVTDAAGCTSAGSVTMSNIVLPNSLDNDTLYLCPQRSLSLMARYLPGYSITWSSPTPEVQIANPSADMLTVTQLGTYILTRTHLQNAGACPAKVEMVNVLLETNCPTTSPCETYQYEIPEDVPVDVCSDNLRFAAKAEAMRKFDLYLEQVKRDFTNNFVSATMNSLEESLTMSYTDKEQHYTLYYYDQAGNLVRTVPPAGVRKLSPAETTQVNSYWEQMTDGNSTNNPSSVPDVAAKHTLASTYKYNSLNQLIAQDIPDHTQQDLWETQQSLVLPSGQTVATLDANGTKVWAFANSSDQAFLYTSNDAGQNFMQGLTLALGNILDIQRAGSTGDMYFAVGTQGLILKAASGAANWSIVASPVTTDLIKVHFSDQNNGFIIDVNGNVWKTSNSGSTWTSATTSVSHESVSLGTLTNALSGKTIADVKVQNNSIYITVNDATRGYVYASGDLTTFNFTSQLFLVSTLNKVYFDGSNTEILSGNHVFRKSGTQTFVYNRSLSGLSGTINEYLVSGTYHIVQTSAGVYVSSNGNSFSSTGLGAGYTLVKSNGRVIAYNGTVSKVFSSGSFSDLYTASSAITAYYYDAANNIDYFISGSSVIKKNSGTGSTTIYAVGISNCTMLAVKDDVAIMSSQWNGTTPVRLSESTSIFITGTTNWSASLVTVNDIAYLNISNVLHSISINASGTPVLTTTSLGTTIPGSGSTASFTFGSVYNSWTYLDYNNKAWTVNAGSSAVELKYVPSTLGSATLVGSTLNVTSTLGVIYQSNWDGMRFVNPSLSQNLGKSTMTADAKLRVVSADHKMYHLNSVGSDNVSSFTEEVATPPLTTAVKSLSQDYLLTTDGKAYKASTTSGVTTWTLQTADLTGFNVINGANTTLLAGGNNAAIRYNSGSGWLSPAPFKVAPVRDAAVSANGTTIVAVGDHGNILVSTNSGSAFMPVKAPDVSDYTSVSLYESGYVVGASNGLVYYFASTGSNAYTTSVTANAQPVRRLLTTGAKLWALRGKEVLYSTTAASFTTALTSAQDLYDITIHADNYGFITGNAGTAYRIVPEGIVEEAESTTLTPITLADGKVVKLIATDNNITDDAGTGIPPSNLRTVRFTDRLTGHITGTGGIVLKTTDGGYHWKPEGSFSNSSTGNALLTFNGNENGVYADITSLGVIRDRAQTLGSRFWYDELGRLILSQNSKQYNIQNYLGETQYSGITVPGTTTQRIYAYSYTLYDEIGRITEVGELLTRAALTTYKHESQVRYSVMETSFIPSGIRTQITRTYYDRTKFFNLTNDFTQENLRPRVASVTYQDRDNTAYDRATHYSYDIHGNVKTLLQEIHAGGENIFKRLDYDYDLISGNVHYVYFQKDKEDGFTHHYTYDGDNRIQEVFTSTDNVIWNKEVDYDYYAHGPLARMTTGRDNVDQCDYAYTIQGWIKGVNAQHFAYALGYFNNDYASIGTTTLQATPMAKNLYNGNISTMTTHTPALALNDISKPVTYTQQYTYDQLNRITGSTVATQGDKHKTTYSYDANGNIETLQRYNEAGVLFDNMAYKYHKVDEGYLKNTNRLRWVDDAVTTSRIDDIEDQERDNYGYDDIGNLIHDEKEEIERIEWNVYGKVDAVIRKAGSVGRANLYFEYDASGNRVSKTSVVSGISATTYYLRDATGNVMSVYKKEGAVAPELEEQYIYGSSRLGVYRPGEDVSEELEIGITSGRHSIGRRNYEYSDHLGNVRVVFSDLKVGVNNGIVAAYEYYPFGMVLDQVGGDYRYGFNGKENDEEWGGDSYDFGARMYDARLGRMLTLDPKISYYSWQSGYSYYRNCPLMIVDINGEGGENATPQPKKEQFHSIKAASKITGAKSLYVYIHDGKDGELDEDAVKEEAGSWDYVIANNLKEAENILKTERSKLGTSNLVDNMIFRSHGSPDGYLTLDGNPNNQSNKLTFSGSEIEKEKMESITYLKSIVSNEAKIVLTGCNVGMSKAGSEKMAKFFVEGTNRSLFVNVATTISSTFDDSEWFGEKGEMDNGESFVVNFTKFLVGGQSKANFTGQYGGFRSYQWDMQSKSPKISTQSYLNIKLNTAKGGIDLFNMDIPYREPQ